MTIMQLEKSAEKDAIWPEFARRKSRPFRLLLVDDHPVVREGICALLSLESDITIVGDVGDIDSGIELYRRFTPDLMICDLNMPGCTGGSAVRKVCREFPTARVMVLTADDSLECMRESFAAGAIGYVRKDALRADLLTALRRAVSGSFATCQSVGDIVMRDWLLETRTPVVSADGPLSDDERKILRLIALGVPTWRIAADLRRGVKAVEKTRANLMRRLNLNNAAAVTRFAVRCNLLSREEVDRLVSTE